MSETDKYGVQQAKKSYIHCMFVYVCENSGIYIQGTRFPVARGESKWHWATEMFKNTDFQSPVWRVKLFSISCHIKFHLISISDELRS